MLHRFKISNKDIFCQLSRTHPHFSIVRLNQKPNVKECEIMEFEYKKK